MVVQKALLVFAQLCGGGGCCQVDSNNPPCHGRKREGAEARRERQR